MKQRQWDLIVLGATGFTGGLTAEYLARSAPASLRWALAGRSRARLEDTRKRLTAINGQSTELGLLEVNLADAEHLAALAKSTAVLITTIGPYTRLGEPVVAACARAGTHYADLAGEPEFVAKMIAKYDALARAQGAKIVNSCGFDSIPHDYGALFTVRQLPNVGPIEVRGYVRVAGTFSGGSWHSAIYALQRWRETRSALAAAPRRRRSTRRVGRIAPRIYRVKALGRWACPFPTIDAQVVMRTAWGLADYGPDFRYGHYLLVKRLPKLLATLVGAGGIAVGAQFRWTRDMLLGLREPGAGPTEAQRERGWFKVSFIGRGGRSTVMTCVSGGDPGYGDTAKMLAEAGLCLACDGDRLPDRVGLLTPVLALGDALFPRLERAGIHFEVLSA